MNPWDFEATRFKILRPPSPAAGADWTYTNVEEGNLRIWYMRAQFVTSAVVASRGNGLNVGDGTDNYYTVRASNTQAANITAVYSGAIGDNGAAATTVRIGWSMPGPGLYLPRGWSLVGSTNNIDAGDQWSAIRLWAEVLPDGPDSAFLPDPGTRTEPRL